MRALPVAAIAIVAAGCSAPPQCASRAERAFVLTSMPFVRQNPPGVSKGFDLDNHVAAAGDALTCGHASLVSPDGVPGIDNQLSELLPSIDNVTHNALDGLIQDAINAGGLLVGIDLTHVDSLKDEPCVDVEFNRLGGTPLVGTDKVLLADQTFAIDQSAPVSTARGALKGGVLDAGPFELELPVRLLDASFILGLHEARFRATFADDGSVSGIIGGGVLVDELLAQVIHLNIGAMLQKLLPVLLQSTADLAYDPVSGNCRQLSATVAFTAKSAFIDR
jgi:hypothetical protein